jgi:hypothetical protein
MRLNSVLMSQAIRFLTTVSKRPRTHNMVQFARQLEGRYGFLQGPRTVNEYDMSKGIVFLRGIFAEDFVIDRFQAYENGVLCEMASPTSKCDEFLTDVLAWIEATFDVLLTEQPSPPRVYLSQVEVVLEKDMERIADKFEQLGKLIATKLNQMGHALPSYSLSGFRMQLDPTLEIPKPPEFVLEKRAGKPYSEHIYYSAAPLPTERHLELLTEVESVLSR